MSRLRLLAVRHAAFFERLYAPRPAQGRYDRIVAVNGAKTGSRTTMPIFDYRMYRQCVLFSTGHVLPD